MCGNGLRTSGARATDAVRCELMSSRTTETGEPAYFAAAAVFFGALASFAVFAAALRVSDVCTPNRLVKRSTRPSVSISFWRPVKNGWQLLQISRCSSGLVDRVFHVAPHAQR